jgi:hypothetical protein
VAEEPHLDNPAGRLHALLERFGSHRESQIIAAWNSALGVEPPNVPRALIGVAGLVEDTKQACNDTGETMFVELPGRLDVVSSILFQPTYPMSAAVSNILPIDWDFILKDIRGLSRFLNQHGVHSKMPDYAEVAELVKAARDLIAAVTNSDALPPEVKTLLIQQLMQVLATLEQVRIYGPEKVRLDVLAVAATVYACEPKVAASHPATKVSSIFDPIKSWAATVLTAVAIIGNTGAAVLTWDHVFQGQLEAPAAHVDVTIESSGEPSLPTEAGH